MGGTINNGNAIKTLWRTVLTFEGGGLQSSNEELSKSDPTALANSGFKDLSDYTVPTANGPASDKVLPRYKNMNWMVEVDPATATTKKKQYCMGRFSNANVVVVAADEIYMSTGTQPSVLFRYVADVAKDLSKGKLFFYKEESDGTVSTVPLFADAKGIPIDATFDDLLVAQEKALKMGATMFSNLNGLSLGNDGSNDLLYIAEKGLDNSGDNFTNPTKKFNGKLAKHLEARDKADGNDDDVITDYYGRILAVFIDQDGFIATQVHLEGGTTGQYNFANPNSLEVVAVTDPDNNVKDYLIIKEDINNLSQNRNPSSIVDIKDKVNETYWLDLNLFDASYQLRPAQLTDLNLFLVGPKGSIIGGGSFNTGNETSVNDTYFVVIKDPNPSNTPKFNRSMLIAVTNIGKGKGITGLNEDPIFSLENSFQIWPNPASGVLHFNQVTDIGIYDSRGILFKVSQNVQQVNVSELNTGIYFIKNKNGQINKLIVE